MADALAHRGPDARGTLLHRAVALGHRRLSILDLSSAGAQPMEHPSGRHCIVYNGEAYNHLDLRRRLTGARWRGTSDTETLLEAYDRYGPGFISDVNGMFAIAVHDRVRNHLEIFRDRAGEKPLYYFHHDGTFAFASELKALLLHPHCPRTIDREALRDYLLFNYIPGPRTILAGVFKLPPGHRLSFHIATNRLEVMPYWQPTAAADPPTTLEEATDRLEHLMLDSTRLRTLADVPLGCFLSGGIDSSLIAWALAKCSDRPIEAFTIAFDEGGYDESPHAAAVARELGANHHVERLSPRAALDLVPALPRLYDEPFADASMLPTALLCRLARRHVTVALSGDGGDELFLGYDRYRALELVRARLGWMPRALRGALAAVLRAVPHYRLNMVGKGLGFRNWDTAYGFLFAGWSQPLVNALLGESRDFNNHPIHALGAGDLVSAAGLTDLLHYLPDDILVKVDRAAMACSLETRVPLLDHRLIEFALSLPTEMKYRREEQKLTLRRVLYRHLPRALFQRPKAGFAVPLRHWFRGEFRPLVNDLLAPDALRRQGHFHPATVQRLLAEHDSGRANHERYLWALLVFQLWHREYLS
jgi:asparagine synthase (glutamine-hydrolysing)